MSTMLLRKVLWVTVSLLLILGCRRDEASESLGAESSEKPSSKVVATIGDEQITDADLEEALERLPQNRRERYRDNVLNHMIEVRVFAEEARKAGLDKDAKTQEALERATNEVLARSFVKKYIDEQAKFSDDEVKQYYEEHQDQFEVPEGVLIQQILVQRKKQAEEIVKALKEGASFEELAKKKSIARSWKEGGRLGWRYKGKMDPALEKVAFDLEKGRISEVIDTEEGYQVIRVLEKSDKRQIGFEEAKTRMGLGLFRKRKGELVHQYYQEAKVDTDPAEAGVLAKVGDEALTEEDLAPILAKAPEKEKEKLKRRWIRYFIETKVFSGEARKVGLENESDVADELSRRTDEVLANTFRKRFILDKCRVTDKEVADYYQSHAEAFRTPLRIRVRTIVVGTREEAEEILQALKEGGAFGTLAKERSIHASAPRYGELGWFGKGEKDPGLEKAALSLEKDQISDIIKTEAGYEIIKLMDKTGGEVRPLEKVEQGIKMTLQAKKMEQEKARYYKEAGVKVVQ